MKTSRFALPAALSLLLAACTLQTETDSGPAPVIQTAAAAERTVDIQNAISVTGTGEVAGVPDTLIVDLGVSVLRPTVERATGDAASLADAVIEALKSNGVEERDIQTTNYAIHPEYDYSGERQRITGYRVTNTVSAKIRDIAAAGTVIDAASAAGGDDTVVHGVRLDLEADSELVKAARRAAWEDASDKATQLAELAGVGLGSPISITETTSSAPPPIAFEAAREAADVATPIQPGEQLVSVTLQVQFAIGG